MEAGLQTVERSEGTLAGRRRRSGDASDRGFDLVRWFATVSAVAIIGLALICAAVLERFLTSQLLQRDAETMTQFLNGFAQVERAERFFRTNGEDNSADMDEFVEHLAVLPGVVRAIAYGSDRSVIWSTDEQLIGRKFDDNRELEEAFQGRIAVEPGDRSEPEKEEHAASSPLEDAFIENYLPVWSDTEFSDEVVGVVEIYRSPALLLDAIRDIRMVVWSGAVVTALVLYLSLFGVIMRASRTIQAQSEALAQSRTLAALGEMASAVAHSLRNPLAAMRSSAELALDSHDGGERRELLTDIVTHADRMEGWIRQYLSSGHAGLASDASCDLADVIHTVVAGFRRQARRSGIELRVDSLAGLGEVRGSAALLTQAINSVISNAIEAMPDGGVLELVAWTGPSSGSVMLELRDDGVGMTDEQLATAFDAFSTSKRNGLGLGLPIARQILRRQGGELQLFSEPAVGTVATLRFAAA